MVRGLPLERRWLIVAAAVLAAGVSVADAANTSRPTGRGAIHDNSVYCQNSPGQPARPEYRGTGSQNPFGGECGPGPQPQPQPQPQAEEADACPLRQASAPMPGVILAANDPAAPTGADVTNGLWVDGHKVLNGRQVGLADLDGRRKEIFEAMRCHRTRAFRFQTNQRLKDTIELRVKILERMDERIHRTAAACFVSETGGLDLPTGWEQYPEAQGTLIEASTGQRIAARSSPGVTAHAAIEAFRHERSGVDCHLGMQVAVLDAADRVLGATRFDNLHPLRAWSHFQPVRPDGSPARYALVGLGVALMTDIQDITLFPGMQIGGFRILPAWEHVWAVTILRNASLTSLGKHLLTVRYDLQGAQAPANDQFAGPIRKEDMVPGDWGYLKNVPEYETYVASGSDAGENVFYIGQLDADHSDSRVFFGVGLEGMHDPPRFVPEAELKDLMARDFNRRAPQRPPAQTSQMAWTRLGSPVLDDSNLQEAGLFVR